MRSIRIVTFGLLVLFCVISIPVHALLSVANTEVVEEYWPDGQLRLRKEVLRLEDGSYVDHGSFERWHSNGKKEYEAFFVRGKKEGTTIRYHKNGQKASEQEYKNGKRHGRCRSWNEAGALVKEENWKNGMPHGTWTIWEKGEVKWSHTYDHGKP
jgi:antitoxin component YwqK of YwqJK toxin-antitoxin module